MNLIALLLLLLGTARVYDEPFRPQFPFSPQKGVMAFTAKLVADEHKTIGFCSAGRLCMVAVYTGHMPGRDPSTFASIPEPRLQQSSGPHLDEVRGNPVLDQSLSDFRDPGAFWSIQARRWIMAVSAQ